jgi:two-component system phosphate regulon sensor histidine kinase PhoR
VDPRAIEVLTQARRRRLIRYGSEGTFLLLVLAGGIATLSNTLRQPAELMKRQANFIAAVSHEFKTPIASMKLSCETLLMREASPEIQQKLGRRMLEDADRLDSMVTNILETARVDEGRIDPHPEELLLSAVISPIYDTLIQRGLPENCRIELDLEPDLGIYCDPLAIATAIDNLMANALQSISFQGHGKVSLIASTDGAGVRIEVKDDGIGFPPKEARKLFEKFYRPGDELRRQTKGSGLGLFIVESMIELNGGHVSAKSSGPGQGASFSLWLPKHEGVRT